MRASEIDVDVRFFGAILLAAIGCALPHFCLLLALPFSMEGAGSFEVKELADLRKLHLESTALRNLLVLFPFGRIVKNLTVVSTKWEVPVGVTKSILALLLCVFPNVGSLTLTAGVWSEFEMYPKSKLFSISRRWAIFILAVFTIMRGIMEQRTR